MYRFGARLNFHCLLAFERFHTAAVVVVVALLLLLLLCFCATASGGNHPWKTGTQVGQAIDDVVAVALARSAAVAAAAAAVVVVVVVRSPSATLELDFR